MVTHEEKGHYAGAGVAANHGADLMIGDRLHRKALLDQATHILGVLQAIAMANKDILRLGVYLSLIHI